jgi:hypothetical protein
LAQVEQQEALVVSIQSLLQTQVLVAVRVVLRILMFPLRVVLVVVLVDLKAVLLETHLLHHRAKVIMVGLLAEVLTAVVLVVVELLPLVATLVLMPSLVVLVALVHLPLLLAQL